MQKTICDECGREFEAMDESVSQQGIHIKLTVISGRRGHQNPRHYDFDDLDCAIEWLRKAKTRFPELIWKSTEKNV